MTLGLAKENFTRKNNKAKLAKTSGNKDPPQPNFSTTRVLSIFRTLPLWKKEKAIIEATPSKKMAKML